MSTISSLQVALQQELRRIDRFIARIWVVLYGVGIVFSLVVAATISRQLGLTMSVMAMVMLGMFLVAERALLRRPLGQRTPLGALVAKLSGEATKAIASIEADTRPTIREELSA